uniref:DNA-binding protein n=1 Tax=Thermocrispum agreste TaxID=37925 RepID=A0A2W4JQF0_9PSEU|nr:MAG: DNA-binding protein [Thermocrispum agreste]
MRKRVTPVNEETFGSRLKRLRTRAGMTRPQLGGLVGRSGEWVKALETGRILPPRLPMMVRLAEALRADDLAELTGDERLAMPSYSNAAHEQLPAISRALLNYPLTDDVEPDVDGIVRRVEQAWELWHGSRRHRTAVAVALPSLLRDARVLPRLVEGNDRRRALVALAQVYHLTQLYLSFQPVPNLVMLAADRAMTAAQDADDPRAMAAAAWYVNHVHRDAGEAEEVRVQLAHDTARLLDPERDRAEYGLLYLAIALSHAKVGREGDAWRAWDVAEQAARGVEHPWLKFGPGMVHAYQVTMLADLQKSGEAVRRADALDFAALGSMTRRAFHTIETARAFYAQREYVAAVALLRRANEIAPETTRYNLFARFAVTELANSGGATVRDDAERLATALGVTA